MVTLTREKYTTTAGDYPADVINRDGAGSFPRVCERAPSLICPSARGALDSLMGEPE